MKKKFIMLLWKLLINIAVVSLTVYIIHSLFEITVTNAITACGLLIFVIGLMSLINGRVYSSGYPSSGMSSLHNSMYSPPANNVVVDVETERAERDLDPEYVNHDRKKPFLFKRSNFELIGTGIILIALGLILEKLG